MNIGVFAYGRAGCKIAEQLKRFEARTRTSITAFTMAADTASEQLLELDRIDDDWKIVYGQQQFGKTGSGGHLKPSLSAAEQTTGNIVAAVNTVPRVDLDAFLVLGSLGGGTGGAGTSVCARVLGKNFPDIPIYGVGVLPSNHDPDIYRFNAARAVQSFARESDNLILFDNNHLNVGLPEYHPAIQDDASHSDVFGRVNQDIARCLHMVFSADQQSGSGDLDGAVLETDELETILNAGGLSTMCYVSEVLPREARPGVTGRIWELLSYIRLRHEYRKDKQEYQRRKERVQEAKGTTTETDRSEQFDEFVDDVTGSLQSIFGSPDNATIRTQPDPDVTTTAANLPVVADETPGEVVLHDDTRINTRNLPRVPQPGDPAFSDVPEKRISLDAYLQRDWPHPTKLAPLLLDPNSAMMPVSPSRATRNLFLLIGPSAHLHQSHTIATSDWASEHTNAQVTAAKAYPKKTGKVAALSLCSGIGIPDRVKELQRDAARIAQTAQENGDTELNPREFDVFKGADTDVPPAF